MNIDNKGLVRPVDEYRETPFGLYMSRPMVNRPTADWMQTWLLPELGIAVTDWWWKPGHSRDQDFYLDICDIVRDGGALDPDRPLPRHRACGPGRAPR